MSQCQKRTANGLKVLKSRMRPSFHCWKTKSDDEVCPDWKAQSPVTADVLLIAAEKVLRGANMHLITEACPQVLKLIMWYWAVGATYLSTHSM